MIFASSRKAIRVSVRQTHGYFIYCQLVFHYNNMHPKLESRRKIFQRIQSNSFLIVYQNKSNGFHLFVRTHTWKTVVKASFKQFFYRPACHQENVFTHSSNPSYSSTPVLLLVCKSYSTPQFLERIKKMCKKLNGKTHLICL